MVSFLRKKEIEWYEERIGAYKSLVDNYESILDKNEEIIDYLEMQLITYRLLAKSSEIIANNLMNSVVAEKSTFDSKKYSASMEKEVKSLAKECCVYLIKSSINNYKIGVSNNPEARMRQLQSGQKAYTLTLQHKVKFDSREKAFKKEKQLHSIFKSKKSHGEWFDFDLDEIGSVITAMNQITQGE